MSLFFVTLHDQNRDAMKLNFKTWQVVVLLFALYSPDLRAQKTVPVELREVPDSNRVEVFVSGEFFTAYFQPEKVKKPVLWPVVSPGGHEITRSFPLAHQEGERVDHPHQVGAWFNFGDVNGLDFWNNSEAIAPENRARYGTVEHRSVDLIKNGRRDAELTVSSDWTDMEGNLLLHETSTFRFLASDQLRIIDRTTTLTAARNEVTFTDNKEGLFAIRVATELEMGARGNLGVTAEEGKVRSVTAESRLGISGNYLSSEGVSGEEAWGKRARWMALSGRIGGEEVAVVIIDHPSNPGYPAHWHARGYGLFSANNMGQKAFSAEEEPFSLTLLPGRQVTFRHRLVVGSGGLTPGQISRLVNSFVCCRKSKLISKEWK